jgi:hypothetical protein
MTNALSLSTSLLQQIAVLPMTDSLATKDSLIMKKLYTSGAAVEQFKFWEGVHRQTPG